MNILDGNSVLGSGGKRFKTLPDGTRLFYPTLFGRGFVLASEKQERRLQGMSVVFNLICIASFFMLRWPLIVWSLTFLPGAWAAYIALNFYALRKCATVDTRKPENKPDIISQILLAGGMLTSCLFGALFYFHRWPSLSVLFMLFWGELLLSGGILVVFHLRKAARLKSEEPKEAGLQKEGIRK